MLGKNLTKEQLTHLFMKIDANSDGSVDWDEFTNFMLLENQAAADMSDRTFTEKLAEPDTVRMPPDTNPKSAYHKDMIENIMYLGRQARASAPVADLTFKYAREPAKILL